MSRRRYLYQLVLWTSFSLVAHADEIRLKDGSKIVGTIIGYEDGAFKVETSYGFATVWKANISEIIPAVPENPAKAKKESKAAETGASKAAANTAATMATPRSSSDKRGAPAPEQIAPRAPATSSPLGTSPPPTPVKNSQAPVVADPQPATAAARNPPAAPSQPGPPPEPQEVVTGNLYANKTYGFSMYKPPAWEILQDARSAMPEAITAVGTSDHSTLLVIGYEVSTNSVPLSSNQLEAHAAATERKLQGIYENYRPLSSRRISLGGLAADEQRFRGSADGHDWSVVAVTLARGKDVFTILGMTYADSDLIQLEENVINRVLASLRFTPTP